MPLLRPASDTTVYWKSLADLRAEARAIPPPHEGASRRDFLALMGFSLGAAACSRGVTQEALPFVSAPEELTPGVPNWYATTCGGCLASCPLVVKTRDGRPIKIEGNRDAPLFGGGTCAVGQATVLALYDEQRLRQPLWHGAPVSWPEIDDYVEAHLRNLARRNGRVVLLSRTITSPSTRDIIARWERRYGGFRHVVHDPPPHAAIRSAYAECFGQRVIPHYRFDKARLIVAIEADFLGTWLSPVEFTAQYARRRVPDRAMSHHVQIESGLSLSGANADVRYSAPPSEIGAIALSLLRRVRPTFALRATADRREVSDRDVRSIPSSALDTLAARLDEHRGESLVVCGAADNAAQTIVAALNHVLGNVGRTIELTPSSLPGAGGDGEIGAVVTEMARGDVGMILLYGVNPAYDYEEPATFARALGHVPLSISFADRVDETAAHVDAVCPDHHFLEAWGDAEPVRGYLSLRQPTIAPLFDTRAVQDSLLKWLGERPDFHEYLRTHWRQRYYPRANASDPFDTFWDRTLQAGFLAVATEPEPPPKFAGDIERAADTIRDRRRARLLLAANHFELHRYETVALRDGVHANNPWLQELPDPITKLTWGHGVAMAPAAADRLGVRDGDVVAIINDNVRVELPVYRQPGQSPTAISIARGYGRTHAGPVANGVGVNVARLTSPYVLVETTGRTAALAATQTHHSMEGRPIVREATLAAFLAEPTAQRESAHASLDTEARSAKVSLWPEHQPGAHTWGLTIDLNACTGCGACVIACQAENNVPVVGKEEVRRGREMHWIRVDRYYSGSAAAPEVVFQPVMCQHCANAPCETVCPVLATVHSSDGLNEQVYNRCVGTRYCENNCPYKVRRFNWFAYANNPRFDFNMNNPLGTMVLNPDVVVRSRGVMEKCSLCIQRIQAGKLAAKQAGVPLADGEIQTACQQACPAKAIVFGDLRDSRSEAARLREGGRHYALLDHLGTRPAVGYLARIRNRERST
jgi:molybdopterin-containing oxidoreductase family iron-sulfur binding subunit